MAISPPVSRPLWLFLGLGLLGVGLAWLTFFHPQTQIQGDSQAPNLDSGDSQPQVPAIVQEFGRRVEPDALQHDGFLKLEGTLVVPRWTELQGATVSLQPQPGNPAPKRDLHLGREVNFQFLKVPAGNWILEATAVGCKDFRGLYTFKDDGSRHHLLVPFELDAYIRGRVVDSSGLPLEGLEVAALRIVEDKTLAITPRTAICGSDGLFSIRNISQGPYRVIPGGTRYPAGEEKEVQLAGQEAWVDFILPAAGSALVQVLARTDQKPLSGLTVTARRVRAPTSKQTQFGHTSSVRTDKEGKALIPYLPPGEYSFSAFGSRWRRRVERASVRSGIQTQLVIQVGTIKANPRQ